MPVPIDATSAFWEWGAPSEENYAWLARESLVAVDTNVLLAPYRLSIEAAASVLDLLEGLSGRLFVPHQVGLEYHRNRISVVSQQWNTAGAVQRLLSELAEESSDRIRQVKNIDRHSTLEPDDVIRWLADAVSRVDQQVTERQNLLVTPTDAVSGVDRIHARASRIIASCLGDPLAEAAMERLEKEEGPRRYREGIPPGFEDRKKQDRQYGDLIIWTEMIAKAKQERRPLVFVSDDQKSDWVARQGGLRTGPQPALRGEFFKESDQQQFWMYSLDQFLTVSASFAGDGVAQGVIDEVLENTAETQEAERRAALSAELAHREALVATLHASLNALAEDDAGDDSAEASRQIRAKLDRELDRGAELRASLRQPSGE